MILSAILFDIKYKHFSDIIPLAVEPNPFNGEGFYLWVSIKRKIT